MLSLQQKGFYAISETVHRIQSLSEGAGTDNSHFAAQHIFSFEICCWVALKKLLAKAAS